MSTVDDDFDDLMAGLDDLDDFEVPVETVESEVLYDPEEDDDLIEFDYQPDPEPAPAKSAKAEERGKAKALIAVPATKTSEAIRRPLMCGNCAFPQTKNPDESHLRCQDQGGGNRANPDRIFQPCPCPCNYPPEQYECSGCGGTILAAPHYPLDEDGDIHYVHLDPKAGRVTDGECPR